MKDIEFELTVEPLDSEAGRKLVEFVQDPDPKIKPSIIWNTLCDQYGMLFDNPYEKCSAGMYRTDNIRCDNLIHALRPGPLKQREGDQPLPIDSSNPVIHDLVVEDVRKRLELGISRYGQGLKAFDGRDTLRDMYEEQLDAACYTRKLMYERDGK